jgi:hypothetical protein
VIGNGYAWHRSPRATNATRVNPNPNDQHAADSNALVHQVTEPLGELRDALSLTLCLALA